jgi:methyltransferase family protein
MATEKTTPSCMTPRPDVRAAARQSHVQTGRASDVAAGVIPVSDVANFPGTRLTPTLCQYIHDLIDGRHFFDPYGADAMWMRALFSIGALQIYLRGEKPREAVSLSSDLRGVLRDLDEFTLDAARIRSFFEESIRHLETDTATDTLDRAGGKDEELSASVQRIPTMVSKETLQYYKWLARTLQEPGEIVELGSWMGASAACLAEGLSQNPLREQTRIHAYDSFIWRDWMRTYTEAPELLAADIRAGDSFLQYFCGYTEPFRHLIEVHPSVLKTRAEQTALPALEWSKGPIAILAMDFAHDRTSNEAMWRVFSPSFQSDRTIVIFNQFGNIPAGEVREFCRDRTLELVPLHKPHSSAKAFRYRKAVV